MILSLLLHCSLMFCSLHSFKNSSPSSNPPDDFLCSMLDSAPPLSMSTRPTTLHTCNKFQQLGPVEIVIIRFLFCLLPKCPASWSRLHLQEQTESMLALERTEFQLSLKRVPPSFAFLLHLHNLEELQL